MLLPYNMDRTLDIRLIVLDVDGTIAGESNQVSEPVRQAIQAVQAQGIQVALATGRMYVSALPFHTSINSQLPIIAYNGAWIQCPLENKIYQHLPVNQSAALQLLDYLEQPHLKSQVDVHFYLNDEFYVTKVTENTEVYAERCGVTPQVVEELRPLLTTETTKILAIAQHTELIKQILTDYNFPQIYLTQSSPYYLEATHPEANKGLAIKYLAENILNLQAENVMAIGDNFNDTEMLKYAGFSIAMNNGPQEVQQLADWIAPDVEEDGVAQALAKFFP